MNTEHTRRIHLPAAGAVVPWLLTLSFGLAAGLFFAFRYPYHLHYQEQLQLFQWTGSYLREVVLVPGGLADWMGRLLTQFFYHARVGAVLIGLLLVAIQRATWAHASSKAVLYPLSFIPAVLAWMYLCDENALMGAPIALLLALTASLPARGKMGWTGVIALLLYFVAGPMAIVFVLLTPLRGEDRRQRIGLLAIGMAALALALLLARATPYPMERLLTGIHYHRIPTVFPLWIGLSALAASRGADVVLFGHTHTAYEEIYQKGEKLGRTVLEKPLYIFNPGSIGDDGCFGTVEIRDGKMLFGRGEI